jgi:hypothetical protein
LALGAIDRFGTITAVGHPYQDILTLFQATEPDHPLPDCVKGRGVAPRAEDQACLLLLDEVPNAEDHMKVLFAPFAANGKHRFDEFRSHGVLLLAGSASPAPNRVVRLQALQP